MLEENDLLKIGTLINDALEAQDIRFDNIDNKLNELEPMKLRLDEIQVKVFLISDKLDEIEEKLNQHIKQNNGDINQIVKDLEQQKQRIDLLEKAVNQVTPA
ncbi:hypothetical protein HOB30_04495 [Candidatus Falkowbacteria bacterium]|nr:hypothetical protein [Candidatus Falkowbacteria bacterium]